MLVHPFFIEANSISYEDQNLQSVKFSDHLEDCKRGAIDVRWGLKHIKSEVGKILKRSSVLHIFK